MIKTIGLFLLLAVLFSSCRPLAPAASPAAGSLALQPCTVANGTVNAECGELLVPEDRAHPEGRVLQLDLVVVRARNSEDRQPDPLFYLAGGPGGAAASDAIVASVNRIFRVVNDERDIVFLDQRGTDGAHRLVCNYMPDEVFNGPQSGIDNWMKRCLANLDGDPRFYTTAAAMRDLDEARAALGYDKINLYGISYGAAAAQVYMRMFPERVRAVVMDHGTALDLPFRYVLPRASQSALDQIFAFCAQDERCSAAYPDLRGDWKQVLDRLAEGPVVTSFIPPGTDEVDTVTKQEIVVAMHQLMYWSGTYSQIPFLVHTLATTEDWTPIVEGFSQQYSGSGEDSDGILLMLNMIFCFEPAWGTQSGEASRYSPGSYYTAEEEEMLKGQRKLCAALPQPDPALIYPPGKPVALSALMLNSVLDPQNPPSNMDLALNEFTESRVLTERTEGHDTSGSSCRWGVITQYIRLGSVHELDASCMDKQKPAFLIMD
ncbi:MAG TPA: alpha/beta fold hydrolase [Anaerolineales bacterium]